MRLGLLISWPVILPAIVTAQQMIPGAEIPLTPPGYKMLRFDEDYSYLTNQTNRTDLVDPVKYIPLRQEHPLWYLTIGGELRERYQGHYDPNFWICGTRADSSFVPRHTPLNHLQLGRRMRLFLPSNSRVI